MKKIIIIFLCIFLSITLLVINLKEKNNPSEDIIEPINKEKVAFSIKSNSLEPFDLYFLKLENKKENKIYSPLSIKYALSMLADGSEGESKKQILNIIYDYKTKKQENSKNISLANALFIKELYKDKIKNSYKNTLSQKYNANLIVDSFVSPININSFISNKTLGLINNMFDDISNEDIILVNALAIDIEWEDKFIHTGSLESPRYANYLHQRFYWSEADKILENKFENMQENVSGMEIIASINKYDIVKTLGEDNIRNIVKNEFIDYLNNNNLNIKTYMSKNDMNDEQLYDLFLDKYIEEINSNYKKVDVSTEFSFYVDNNIKAFSKKLKEYDKNKLEYIGIMPINTNLDDYINDITIKDINNVINNLKKIDLNNFKDGVVTEITGFIPKFKFDYKLDLMNDLKALGICDIFEDGKANLKNITEENLFINEISHKSNIEFTQDGIKAAAVTYAGGKGAGDDFDYLFDVPIEEIDLTFDKPYMFMIRDTETNEIWFMGTVYNPLLYKEDNTKN